MPRLLLPALVLALCATGCTMPKRIDDQQPAAREPAPAQPIRRAVAPEPRAVVPAAPAVTTPAPADAQQAMAAVAALHRFTGLNDLQLQRMAYVEGLVAQGDFANARTLADALHAEFESASTPYRVQPGDSLWRIAGREEHYGNPRLWPLVWRANAQTVPHPNLLRAGQRLRIRSNPTIAEVVDALDYAARFGRGEVFIGEIKARPAHE